MLFASEKQVSPTPTRNFSTKKAFTVLNTIWSGQMLYLTVLNTIWSGWMLYLTVLNTIWSGQMLYLTVLNTIWSGEMLYLTLPVYIYIDEADIPVCGPGDWISNY